MSGGQQRGGEVWYVQHMCVEEILTTGLGLHGCSSHALPRVVEVEVGLMVLCTAVGPAQPDSPRVGPYSLGHGNEREVSGVVAQRAQVCLE